MLILCELYHVDTLSVERLLTIAKDAAYAAGEAIMRVYEQGNITTKMKQCQSPVTNADRASHAIIIAHLAETGLPVISEEDDDLPAAGAATKEAFWLVDPLDGTKEFLSRNGEFAVNIALVEYGKPIAGIIYAPCTQVMYCGSKPGGVYKVNQGMKTYIKPLSRPVLFETLLEQPLVRVVASRSHLSQQTKDFIKQFKNVSLQLSGSSLKFMQLLEGNADIYPRLAPTMEWDTASAHALLNAANRGIYETDLKTELRYNKAGWLNPSFVAF